ncbi:MAG: type II secretion system protein [Eubacterium sp.]|nr:type II secretion system protein [Eubacterium sp.]
MKKTNNKGFTLVELIVVLVILAILAAILVPALLGYIDRAREKQVTTNAEAALVASQALMADAYKTFANPNTEVTKANIVDLTDIAETSWQAKYSATSYDSTATNMRPMYKITGFTYYSAEYKQTAIWTATTGQWEVKKGNQLAGNVTIN